MSLTVSQAALQLTELVRQGHGDALLSVDTHQPLFVGQRTCVAITSIAVGRDWNHGSVLLWPAEVLTRLSANPPADEPEEIGPVEVDRDEDGFWTHPSHPEGLSGVELTEWFTANGLTYTLNYLLPPEDEDKDSTNFATWELRQPAGNGWFLWDIRMGADGEPLAVWAHKL